jgi:serine/threonine-protein kinase HipA
VRILKPAVERFDGVVFNAALCLKLAAAAGLPAATVETRNVDGIDYLRVQRIAPSPRASPCWSPSDRKYQKRAGRRSGTALRWCGRITGARDTRYLAGDNDAHGKNFSLLYPEARLAPLYDAGSAANTPPSG